MGGSQSKPEEDRNGLTLCCANFFKMNAEAFKRLEAEWHSRGRRFDKSTAQAEEMKAGALRVL